MWRGDTRRLLQLHRAGVFDSAFDNAACAAAVSQASRNYQPTRGIELPCRRHSQSRGRECSQGGSGSSRRRGSSRGAAAGSAPGGLGGWRGPHRLAHPCIVYHCFTAPGAFHRQELLIGFICTDQQQQQIRAKCCKLSSDMVQQASCHGVESGVVTVPWRVRRGEGVSRGHACQ